MLTLPAMKASTISEALKTGTVYLLGASFELSNRDCVPRRKPKIRKLRASGDCSTCADRRKHQTGSGRGWMKVQWQVKTGRDATDNSTQPAPGKQIMCSKISSLRLGETLATTRRATGSLVPEATLAALELRTTINICAFDELSRSTTDLTWRAASAVAAVTPPLNMRHLVLPGSVSLHMFVREVLGA
jgi:hypothetical protein